MEAQEVAGLMQLLTGDKVVVHVSIKRTLAQYESVEVEAWHTVFVAPEMTTEERIALQKSMHEAATLAAEAEAEAARIRHIQMAIDVERLITEQAEARKTAAMARAAAAKAEKDAMAEVRVLPTPKAPEPAKASNAVPKPAASNRRSTVVTPRPSDTDEVPF